MHLFSASAALFYAHIIFSYVHTCPNPRHVRHRIESPFQCSLAVERLPHRLLGYVSQCLISKKEVFIPPTVENTRFGKGMAVEGVAAEKFRSDSMEDTCPIPTRHHRCKVWIEEDIWAVEPQSRWFRRVDVDDHSGKQFRESLTAWEVAYRAGLETEPALLLPFEYSTLDSIRTTSNDYHARTIFLPKHYLPFVRIECHPSLETKQGELPRDGGNGDFRSVTEMASRKIITIGDLHGDFYQTARTFYMAGVIDAEGHWAGGNHTIFVQTGDVVDRGHDTIALYSYLEILKREAYAAGGEFIQLLGNHELMNLGGDLRFVSAEDTASFGSEEARRVAFRASGFIGRHLFRLPLVHRVGNIVFAHGGISEKFSRKGVGGINAEKDGSIDEYVKEPSVLRQYTRWPLFGDEGPAWFRGFAEKPEPTICYHLRRALRDLKAERMVVGHTVQLSGRLLVRCDARFIVTDVGISRVYGGNVAALEIHGDKVWAIYEHGRELVSDGFAS